MKKIFMPLFLLMLILQTACTTNTWQSQQEIQLEPSDTQAIVNDIINAFAHQYPPAQTQFNLSLDEGEFGETFETTLRDWGYGIENANESNSKDSVKLAYSVDALEDDKTFWVGVRIAPDFRLDRLYRINKNQFLVPATGFSIRGATHVGITGQIMPENILRKQLDKSWTVQIYASKYKKDLKKHQVNLRNQGYFAHVVPVGSSGKMKALRLGPYINFNQAKDVQKTMKHLLFEDAYVIAPSKRNPS